MARLNRSDVVKVIADRTNLSKDAVIQVLLSFEDYISDILVNGDTLLLKDFGKFEARAFKECTSRNMHTGEMLKIPPRLVPRFTPSPYLKKLINN